MKKIVLILSLTFLLLVSLSAAASDAVVAEGDRARFHVTAAGDNLTYQSGFAITGTVRVILAV